MAGLAVGGGVLALVPMPGRGGDLDGDMRRVLDFAPDLVVSMTQTAEMVAAGDMVALLRARGIDWRHFPVADYDVPDAAGEATWPGLSQAVRAVLARGGRVLLHCMGGCGRSGMVALRLMVEGGEAPGPAVARLRARRACAVETAAQMAWASGAQVLPR